MDDYSSYRVDHDKARELGLPEGDRILYVLTIADLAQVYGDVVDETEESQEGDPRHFWNLPQDKREDLIEITKKYIDFWTGDGGYTWYDALADAIRDNMSEIDKQESQVS